MDSGWAITGAGTSAGITIYSLRTQEYERLTDFGDSPVWLSDSRRILFYDFTQGKIFLVDSKSGRVREVLSISPDIVDSLSVSPDNRSIYFSRSTSEADIWLLTLNEER